MRGQKAKTERVGSHMEPFDFDKLAKQLKEKFKRDFDERDLLSAALYPKVMMYLFIFIYCISVFPHCKLPVDPLTVAVRFTTP